MHGSSERLAGLGDRRQASGRRGGRVAVHADGPEAQAYYLRMHATTQPPGWSDDVVTLAVEVLRVLADPTRLQLAGLLLDEEQSVSQLAATLDKPVPGVSQHLAKMRMARLVTTRKQGTSVLYRVENGHVRQLVVDTIGHVEHLLDVVPPHHRATEGTA